MEPVFYKGRGGHLSGWDERTLASRSNGDPQKVMPPLRVCAQTPVIVKWIAMRLHISTLAHGHLDAPQPSGILASTKQMS